LRKSISNFCCSQCI